MIGQPATTAASYQFTAVEVKQTAFRFDGIFLPTDLHQPLYFVEVQTYSDPLFYARLFAEIFLYLYRHAPAQPWQAVILFATRSLEPTQAQPYLALLASPQVQRVYLDELGDSEQLGVTIVQLVVAPESVAPARARTLLVQTQAQVQDQSLQREVIELIETIMVYKFPRLSRQELEVMLNLDTLKQTKVYQEGRQEGEEQTKLRLIPVLLARGLSPAEVADILSLTLAQVIAHPEQS